MTTVTIEEAQANLLALIAELRPGEEVVIVRKGQPVARLIVMESPAVPLIAEQVAEPAPHIARTQRRPGSAVGRLEILQEDEAHLEDFREYMP